MNLGEHDGGGGGGDAADRRLVELSRDGRPEEFEHLVRRYERPLFAFLRDRVSNESDAKEAAQDAFVRAFLSLKKLRKPDSFYAWLLGIGSRVLKERYRESARVVPVPLENEPAAECSPNHEPLLDEAIAALPDSCRQVILLRYYEGLSCLEIATRLGMPLGTVTKTLSRAYAFLRKDLQTREEAETAVKKNNCHELR